MLQFVLKCMLFRKYKEFLHSFYPPPKLRGGFDNFRIGRQGGSRPLSFERGGCHLGGVPLERGGLIEFFLILLKYRPISNFGALIWIKIQKFSGLRPSPFYKDSIYTVIYYLPTLWVLVGQRSARKISTKIDSAQKGGVRKFGSF